MQQKNHEIRLVLSRSIYDTALCHEEGRGLWSILEFDFAFHGAVNDDTNQTYYLYRGFCDQSDIADTILTSLNRVATAIKKLEHDYCLEHSDINGLVGRYGNLALRGLASNDFNNPCPIDQNLGNNNYNSEVSHV